MDDEDAATPEQIGLLDLVERAFVYVSLFLFSAAFVAPFFIPNQSLTDDASWLRYIWLPVYAGTVLFIAIRLREVFEAAIPLVLFSALALWVYLSVLWSINSETTSRRAFAFVATSLFGIYFGARFRDGEGVVMIARLSVFLAIGSTIAALAYPKMGISHDINAGTWRGLWYEKNSLGAVMAVGAFSCVSAGMITGKGWRWAAGAALCVALVLASRSKTALLVVFVPAALYIALWLARRGPVLAVIAIFSAGTAAGGVLAMLAIAPDIAFKALGKDPTLTGRTEIWASLFRRIAERPITGYGYAAFWEKQSIPAQQVRQETGWSVPTAHNGWIDILVQVGWVGAALTAFLLISVLGCALVRGRNTRDGDWSLMFTLTFVMSSLSESVLIQPNNYDWVLFVFAGTTVMLPMAQRAWEAAPDRSISENGRRLSRA